MTLRPGNAPLDELAALYAAGAMPPAEARAFEARLAADPAAAAELARMVPAIRALAAEAPPVAPPPRVRDELLAMLSPPAPALSGLIFRFTGEGRFEPIPQAPGTYARVLHIDRPRRQHTAIVRMDPGSRYPEHTHDGPARVPGPGRGTGRRRRADAARRLPEGRAGVRPRRTMDGHGGATLHHGPVVALGGVVVRSASRLSRGYATPMGRSVRAFAAGSSISVVAGWTWRMTARSEKARARVVPLSPRRSCFGPQLPTGGKPCPCMYVQARWGCSLKTHV